MQPEPIMRVRYKRGQIPTSFRIGGQPSAYTDLSANRRVIVRWIITTYVVTLHTSERLNRYAINVI